MYYLGLQLLKFRVDSLLAGERLSAQLEDVTARARIESNLMDSLFT